MSARHPYLATQLAKVEEDSPQVRFLQSRTGREVACIEQDHRLYPLHSLFDPEKEGLRFLEVYPAKGFFIFLGLGCGYHIVPFLEYPEVTSLLILDTQVEILRTILGRIDLRKLLLDPRVSILIDPSPEMLEDFMFTHYFPSISGDIKTVPLRSRVELSSGFFQSCIASFQKSIETISQDFTVQTRFGKKWFSNTIANLPVAEQTTCTISPRRKILITAAGPSLEKGMERIQREREENFFIATDTSLPALLDEGIIPDAVVSIDCQHISYHHFLGGLPEHTFLVLDLASPPLLTRLSNKLMFFASSHPFSLYLSTFWRQFPSIDTSGGNVTHAAVSLALTLGADRILLYGADFSFPQGKSYARGSYLYPYFLSHSSRFHPLETTFSQLLFSNQKLERIREERGLRYTSYRMKLYRSHLETFLAQSHSAIVSWGEGGEPIHISTSGNAEKRSMQIVSAGPVRCSWMEFLESYLEEIQSLPPPSDPVISYLDSLPRDRRNLWTTLLPISAVIRKEHGAEEESPSRLLIESRDWAVETIHRHLQSGSNF
ncbi:MAG: hypothetical protein Kow009_06960 [Spirochaetales bacterium]